ncbi:HAD-IA family hydrolase [Arthrobacter sp. MI7-26]|uniref:HAD-IA family hydrolase n=1 Tax=Arthrobacter sp. MI7-26 TaxID=2993653 RepID=UPI002248E01A|nr:HAD-IA family hydrolase [Arthrobacter sp. MI7-26]MCX2749854.1 HAD-IA family hydrolase [Arthrobacter sp. MI7-26]
MAVQSNDVLIFDLFGVIAKDQNQEGREALLATGAVSEEEFWAAYWNQRPPYDRGEVTGTQYWTDVSGQLATSFDPDRIRQLIEHDIASWSLVDDQMIALLEDLSRTRRLALLSDIPQELGEHFQRRHRWLNLFEVRGLSYQIGFAKPERETFEWCIRELGIEPHRALFIDDREENIRSAQEAGLRGHLFTSCEALSQTLEANGTRWRRSLR